MLFDRKVALPFFLFCVWGQPAWAVPKVTPSISLAETYTDNVGLTTSDEEESFIHEISPGISIEDSGAKTSYFANYRYTLRNYSNPDFDDRSENNLSAQISRFEFDRSLNLFANANVRNVQREISSPGFGDGVSGEERTETRSTGLGASYTTGTRQYYDFSTQLNYSHTETDDDTVNIDRYSAQADLNNGRRFDNTFWGFGGDYSEDNNENRRSVTDGILGLNLTTTFGLFAQANREKNDISNDAEFLTESWGAGIRINRAKSSLSVAYNTFEEGGDDEDNNFLSANFRWAPSRRTSISASYGERFFGETYGLDISHQTKRLRQSIRYSDAVTSFSETLDSSLFGFLICPDQPQFDVSECIIPTGETVTIPPGYRLVSVEFPINRISESEVLNRTLSYTAVYSYRKSTFTGNIFWNRSKLLNQTFASQNYDVQTGASLSWNWRMGAKTSLVLTSIARKVETEDLNQVETESKDYTQRVSLQRTFSRDLTGAVTYSHSDRRADDPSGDIRENRIGFSLLAQF